VPILPIRKNGSEGNWQWAPHTLLERLAQGRVKIGGTLRRGFTVYILKDGEFDKIRRGEFVHGGYDETGAILVEERDSSVVLAVPGTQWRIRSHDATQYGTRLLANFLPGRKFPFPKSLYAVEDALRFFLHDRPNAVVLDFFAGSGTTAHAVMRLNHQDGGQRQCISITNNEVAVEEHAKLCAEGLRPGDREWEQWGICDYITKPRIAAAITGKTPEGDPVKGDYKFTDEFSTADGFAENAEFFTLTYETPVAVSHNLAFARIAPLLWMRAGSRGRRIKKIPPEGWAVVESYGLLVELDQASPFLKSVRKVRTQYDLRIAYIVTDDDRRFQAVARRLPQGVEPVRLYESYLTNFAFTNGDDE
jgi:adenine-specific DNA-methyltransferase